MKLVLIGGGGHARVVADVAETAGYHVLGALTPEGSPTAPGLERLGDDGWIDEAPEGTLFHLALGPTHGGGRRAAFFDSLAARGLELPPIVAASAAVRPYAEVGAGSLVVHSAIINPGAKVGRNCIVNTAALVEHDCRVGDHTHVAPGVRLAGAVQVGARCTIGIGAVVLPGISIADGVTVGAGAVVVRPIEESGTIWSGNPARRHG